ncbi:MAG: transporter substrate-binding domain-containing protein [Candidatus Paceibacterota bacterium]
MFNNKNAILILALMACLLAVSAYGQTDENATTNNLNNCGNETVIEILGHKQLKPVTYSVRVSETEYTLRGDAVDIALLVLPESGYPAIPKGSDKPWEETLIEIKENRRALGAAAFSTPGRQKDYIFSDEIGIYDTIVAYTIQNNGIVINGTDDLANLTGGSTAGDSYGPLDSLLKGIKRFNRVEDCLKALNNGTIDYYVGSERAIDEVLSDLPPQNQIIKSPILAEIPFRFIISKNSLIDMDKINETLRS